MTDTAGNVLGIRLRRPSGFKFAVKGGRDGLFSPSTAQDGAVPLHICEGVTDTAAMLDMGFPNAVGRPSCTGGIKLLAEYVGQRRPSEVVIVSDGDEPGRRGADQLAGVLAAYTPAIRVITPPGGIKDAREWLRAGGSRQDVERAIGAAPVRRLSIRTRRVENGR
jgi:DNA primase